MPPTTARNHDELTSPATLHESLDGLLRFGSAMLRAGHTAFRVMDWMRTLAARVGINALAVQLTFGGITATASRGRDLATLVCEVGTPGVNVWKIDAMEDLARNIESDMEPQELFTELQAIETSPPLYSLAQICTAISASSAAFAFINGGTHLDIVAAAIAGGSGQFLRALLLRRRFNQYMVVVLCAILASSFYCLITAMAEIAGFGGARHAVGFVSSVLFLVPGFPVITGLLDLLQHQLSVAMERLAYGAMIMLVATCGLCVVAALAGLTIGQPPAQHLSEPLMVVLRALASFGGACGFAIIFNSPARTLPVVGLLALLGNEIRLALHDTGLMLAAATFIGTLMVGLLASLARRHLKVPRVALTVPGIIMMVPGLYCYEAIVLFSQGAVVAGLNSAFLVGFIVIAMAGGLATARFMTEREYLRE